MLGKAMRIATLCTLAFSICDGSRISEEQKTSKTVASKTSMKGSPTVRFFKAEAVENVLPLPPKDYPEPLQGVIWMDQTGYYGYSDISTGAPDAALSFGDPANMLDKENKKINVDVSGTAFQWFNNRKGYAMWKAVHSVSFKYIFQFNDDYTHAHIEPSNRLLHAVPESLSFLSFTMDLQTPQLGECPPAEGATKQEISKCAKWKRVTNVLNGEDKLYYAFEIIDKDGNRVQPYYDKYVEWVSQNSHGDMYSASMLGVLGEGVEDPGNAAFVGLESADTDCSDTDLFSLEGQTCELKNTLRSISSSWLCPRPIRGVISQALDVLDGKGQPVHADQRYVVGLTQLRKGYSTTYYEQSDTCCDGGDKSCCNHKRANYPGPEAQSYLSSTEIAAKMAAVPSLQASGNITRRNMLGNFMINDMYWYDLPEGERGHVLGGQSVKQHRLVRPKLDKVFGSKSDNWDTAAIEKSAADFLNGRSQVSFKNDVLVWTQQVLHWVVYQTKISEQDAQDMVDFQKKVLKTIILPQFIVDAARALPGGETLLKKIIGFSETQAQKDRYLQRWLPITTKRYCQECSAEEAAMVNTNFLDALIFAGGLSVPGVIAPGIAVLYAGSSSPALGMQLTPTNAEVFAWEAARYFPPVLGFPYVDESEERPLQIMTLGMGQRSGAEWGDDAETPTFRLRDMDTYEKYWVGHADYAVDPKGEMTRVCPGKSLSMAMIGAWFKAWDQAAWAPAADAVFKFKDSVGYVNDFTMEKLARDDDMGV